MKVKRFMVIGVCICDSEDYGATEEEQFDTMEEAQVLLKKYNSEPSYTEGGIMYFVLDHDPDPYEGGHN